MSERNFEIGLARANDVNALVELDPDEERNHFEAVHDRRVYIASIARDVVGYIRYRRDFPWPERGCFVENVLVAEAHRKLGIAKALFGAVEEDVIRRGYWALYSSHAVDNEISGRLHDSLGFEVCSPTFQLVDQSTPEEFRGKLLA